MRSTALFFISFAQAVETMGSSKASLFSCIGEGFFRLAITPCKTVCWGKWLLFLYDLSLAWILKSCYKDGALISSENQGEFPG
jgi:hypothetical protein